MGSSRGKVRQVVKGHVIGATGSERIASKRPLMADG